MSRGLRRLRPFFKFYGSKFNLVQYYPAPTFGTIVEPFAGSASYSTLHHTKEVILYDTWPWVTCLWRGLVNASPKDVRALPSDKQLTPGQDLWSLDLPDWGVHLIGAWQRVGVNDCRTVSKWNGKPGLWSAHVRDTIANQVEQIRHWQVKSGDGIDALDWLADVPNMTKFVDPPYESQKTVYRNKPVSYNALASTLKGSRGQVIVCDLADAVWLPFRPLKENTAGGARSGTSRAKKMEGVWTSDTTIIGDKGDTSGLEIIGDFCP